MSVVTVRTKTPMSPDQARAHFEQVLKSKGLQATITASVIVKVEDAEWIDLQISYADRLAKIYTAIYQESKEAISKPNNDFGIASSAYKR